MEKLQPILKKLQPVLDHLEKVILGAVLIWVAFTSIMQLLDARKIVGDLSKDQDEEVRLKGSDYKTDANLKIKLHDLIAQASGSPEELILQGSNHMVFNPKKWKEIISTQAGGSQVTNLVSDSVTNKLGVSALQVIKIEPLRLVVTPEALLSADRTKVRYRFHQIDQYPMQVNSQAGLLSTFIAHLPMAKPESKIFTLSSAMPAELHSFTKRFPKAALQKFHPDWIVKIHFRGATPPVSPGNVDSVFFNLDIIYTNPGLDGNPVTGNTVTNQNPRVRSKSPIAITRAYQADFLYQTKYQARMTYRGFRVGRHIMMDGEALVIKRITPNEVWLYSDLEFGGNGKLYIKKLVNPTALPAAGGGGGRGAVAQPTPVP
jgi:hypothetical protein